MSSISIKGVLLGALVDFAGSMFIGIAIIAAAAGLLGLGDVEATSGAFQAGVPRIVAFALSCPATVAGGYVAARVAERGELINGTLCTFLSVIVTIMAVEEPWPWKMRDFIELGLIPLAGMLGGYMRLRQVRAAVL